MDYNIIEKIGEGSYSSVYKIKIKENSYAMKKINMIRLTRNQKTYLLSELKILSEHKSSYIIKFYKALIHDNSLNIIMEYTPHGTLDNFMKINLLTNEVIWKFFAQLCAAVLYLHKNNIIHRDIKSANILIDINNNIKLIDFGVSKIMNSYMKFTKSFVGTPLYMSPELFKNVLYDSKIDIWALGIILYQMTHASKLPFECKSFEQLKIHINHPKIEFHSTILRSFKNIIIKCIDASPHKRIKLDVLISHKNIKIYLNNKDIKIKNHINQIDNIPLHNSDWNKILKNIPNKLNIVPVNEIVVDNIKKKDDISKNELQELNERLLDIISEKCIEIEELNVENEKLKKELYSNK